MLHENADRLVALAEREPEELTEEEERELRQLAEELRGEVPRPFAHPLTQTRHRSNTP